MRESGRESQRKKRESMYEGGKVKERESSPRVM